MGAKTTQIGVESIVLEFAELNNGIHLASEVGDHALIHKDGCGKGLIIEISDELILFWI